MKISCLHLKIAKGKRNITYFLQHSCNHISLSHRGIAEYWETYDNKVKKHSKLREELNPDR
jgi:predicted secreted Zn-dependent protease